MKMREIIGRILCVGLGALFAAGAAPLFNFGEAGTQFRAAVETYVNVIAETIGVWPWLLMWLLGPVAIGGPLALVWLIAGKGVNRVLWFLGGILAYGTWWMFGA